MHRGLPIVAALAALIACSACSAEEGQQLHGTRGPCATASGTLLGCDDTTIETPEEACFRLVHCGAMPLEAPNNEFVLDWDRCVLELQGLPQFRYDVAIACIENATCDELKVGDIEQDGNRPLCLNFGNQ